MHGTSGTSPQSRRTSTPESGKGKVHAEDVGRLFTPSRTTSPVPGRSPLLYRSPTPTFEGIGTPANKQRKEDHLKSLCDILGLTISQEGLWFKTTTIEDKTTTPIIGTAKIALLEHLCFCHRWINILGQASEILKEPFTPSHNTNILIALTVEILKNNFIGLTDDNAEQCAIDLITLVTHSRQGNNDNFPSTISPFITLLQGEIILKLNTLPNLPKSDKSHGVFPNLYIQDTLDMKKFINFLKNVEQLSVNDSHLLVNIFNWQCNIERRKPFEQILIIFKRLQPLSSQLKGLNLSTKYLNDFDPTKILTSLSTEENTLASFILEECKNNKLTIGNFLEDFTLTCPYAKCSYPFLASNNNILPILISYCNYAPDPTPKAFDFILRGLNTFLCKTGINLDEHAELTIPLFSSYYLYHNDPKSIEELIMSSKNHIAKGDSNIAPILQYEICGTQGVNFTTQEEISAEEFQRLMILANLNRNNVMQDPTKGGHLFSKSLTGLNHAILLFNNNGVYTVLIKPNVHNQPNPYNARQRLARGGEKLVKLQGIEIKLDGPPDNWQYQRVVTVSQPFREGIKLNTNAMLPEYTRVLISKSIKPTDTESTYTESVDTELADIESTDIGRPFFYTKYLGEPLKDKWAKLDREQKNSVLLQLYEACKLTYMDIKIANVLIDDNCKIHFIDYMDRRFTFVIEPILANYTDSSLLSDQDIEKNAIFGLCTIFFELCNSHMNEYIVKAVLFKLYYQRLLDPQIETPPALDPGSNFPFAGELCKACEGNLTLGELRDALQKLYPDVNFVRREN